MNKNKYAFFKKVENLNWTVGISDSEARDAVGNKLELIQRHC